MRETRETTKIYVFVVNDKKKKKLVRLFYFIFLPGGSLTKLLIIRVDLSVANDEIKSIHN